MIASKNNGRRLNSWLMTQIDQKYLLMHVSIFFLYVLVIPKVGHFGMSQTGIIFLAVICSIAISVTLYFYRSFHLLLKIFSPILLLFVLCSFAPFYLIQHLQHETVYRTMVWMFFIYLSLTCFIFHIIQYIQSDEKDDYRLAVVRWKYKYHRFKDYFNRLNK